MSRKTSSARELSDALTALIKTKEIHAVRDSEDFLAGLDRLRKFAATRTDAVASLLAVSTLQRARAVLKRQASRITEILKDILQAELPSLQLLSSAEERYYAASALELSSSGWVVEYAAREKSMGSDPKERAAESCG